VLILKNDVLSSSSPIKNSIDGSVASKGQRSELIQLLDSGNLDVENSDREMGQVRDIIDFVLLSFLRGSYRCISCPFLLSNTCSFLFFCWFL
jgi:hypothetical protein